MFTEDQLLPLSALPHFLSCPRQCALIHLEPAWAENRFTAEEKVLHQRAHEGPDESRPSVRITRTLPVRSLALGISGQCDVVEFHQARAIFPVGYKRGNPKGHRADEVQLCAQALFIEPAPNVFVGTLNIRTHRKVMDFILRNAPQEFRVLAITSAPNCQGYSVERIGPEGKSGRRDVEVSGLPLIAESRVDPENCPF